MDKVGSSIKMAGTQMTESQKNRDRLRKRWNEDVEEKCEWEDGRGRLRTEKNGSKPISYMNFTAR